MNWFDNIFQSLFCAVTDAVGKVNSAVTWRLPNKGQLTISKGLLPMGVKSPHETSEK